MLHLPQHSPFKHPYPLNTLLDTQADALRRYDGPTCFLVPGNHDWFDGLETYQRHILHKGWIGGWLMPQEASYFALQLPHGWWFFGFDLALDEDIDLCQFRYFASIADALMGPTDQVILLTHQPTWLLDWYWGHRLAPNLQQLIRRHLRGRARMHIAGDLHFYMRHSAHKAAAAEAAGPGGAWEGAAESGFEDSFAHAPALLGGLYAWDPASGEASPLGGSPRGRSPLGGSPLGGSPIRGRSPVRAPVAEGKSPSAQAPFQAVPAAGLGGKPAAAAAAVTASSTTDVSSASDRSNSCDDDAGERLEPKKSTVTWAPPPAIATAPCAAPAAPQGTWAPTNPEHLVVCGMGGAFMHPTHVFAGAVFGPSTDAVDGPVFVHRPRHGANVWCVYMVYDSEAKLCCRCATHAHRTCTVVLIYQSQNQTHDAIGAAKAIVVPPTLLLNIRSKLISLLFLSA